MDDLFLRMLELAKNGYNCSQIIVQCALDIEGKENPDLLRAVGGLSNGLGHTGGVCGALTGGCCALGLFLTKGEDDEEEDPRANDIIAEYVAWFAETMGSTECLELLRGDWANKKTVCPDMNKAAIEKVIELLEENEVLDW